MAGVTEPQTRRSGQIATAPPVCALGAHARLPPGHRQRWGSTPASAEFTLHRVTGDAYASTDRVAAADGARFEVRGTAAGEEVAAGVFFGWPW